MLFMMAGLEVTVFVVGHLSQCACYEGTLGSSLDSSGAGDALLFGTIHDVQVLWVLCWGSFMICQLYSLWGLVHHVVSL